MSFDEGQEAIIEKISVRVIKTIAAEGFIVTHDKCDGRHERADAAIGKVVTDEVAGKTRKMSAAIKVIAVVAFGAWTAIAVLAGWQFSHATDPKIHQEHAPIAGPTK